MNNHPSPRLIYSRRIHSHTMYTADDIKFIHSPCIIHFQCISTHTYSDGAHVMSADESQIAFPACLLVLNFAVNTRPAAAPCLRDFSRISASYAVLIRYEFKSDGPRLFSEQRKCILMCFAVLLITISDFIHDPIRFFCRTNNYSVEHTPR